MLMDMAERTGGPTDWRSMERYDGAERLVLLLTDGAVEATVTVGPASTPSRASWSTLARWTHMKQSWMRLAKV